MWVTSQTSVPPDATSSAASGRPSRAQQRSRLPLVQTRASGSPSYGLHRPPCSPAPSAAKSRVSSSAGSVSVVVRIQERPGAVCAAKIRWAAGSRQSACRPGRRIRATRTPVPAAASSRARPTAGSRWLEVRASAPQGPGCSISSQVRAAAAVPASGSVSSREAVAHVLT